MSQVYFQGFEAESVGSEPSGITKNSTDLHPDVDNTDPYAGSNHLKLTRTYVVAGTGDHLMYRDTSNLLSTEVYWAKLVLKLVDDVNNRVGIITRGASATGTDEGYASMLRNGNTIRLSSLSGLSETTISTTTVSSFSTGTWYWIKTDWDASDNVKVRHWADGGSEPGTWDISTSSTTYKGTNKSVGVYLFDGSSGSTDVQRVDNIEVDDKTVASLKPNLTLLGVG